MDENTVSGILTTLIGLTGGYIALTPDQESKLVAFLGIIIMAVINHYQSGIGTTPTTPASGTGTQGSPAQASQAPVQEVTITGPFGPGGNKTLTGTRLIIAPDNSFQLINDKVAQDFIVAGGSAGSVNSGAYKIGGDVALITFGPLLKGAQ